MNASFAETLENIQKDIRPEDTGAEIRSVRKTQTGGVLIEQREGTTNKKGIKDAIQQTFGFLGTVSNLEPKLTLEIGDIPETCEDTDVTEALRTAFLELEEIKIGLTSANS